MTLKFELGLDSGLSIFVALQIDGHNIHTNTNNGSVYWTGRLLAAGRSVHDWVSFLRPVCSFPGNITLASCL